MGYNGVADGVVVDRVSDDVKVGNDSMVNSVRNQDNSHGTVEDVENSDDRVTITLDPTDGVLNNILAHFFGLLSPCSNSSPDVTAICSDRSHGNNFKFSFTSLLILL